MNSQASVVLPLTCWVVFRVRDGRRQWKNSFFPDFVIPSKDVPFDVYKVSKLKDKLISFPSKARSSIIKQWVESYKKWFEKRLWCGFFIY